MKLPISFTLLTLGLSGAAHAQAIPTGEFVGQLSEGFDSQDAFAQQCNSQPIFGGFAQVCAEAPDSLMVVYSSTGPESNPCTILDKTGVFAGRTISNVDLNSDSDSGRVIFTFQHPVKRFGGYFANNDSILSPDQGENEVQLYDVEGNLLLDTTFDMANDCTWTWNGWEVASGMPISRVELRGGSSSRDMTLDDFELDLAPLAGSPSSISLSTGGTQNFDLLAGPDFAGDFYFLLGSVSGTSPGLPAAPGITLPLNSDGYFNSTLVSPNGAVLPNSLGVFGPLGDASASLVLPPATLPSLAGIQANHAYVVIDSATTAVTLASNAIPVQLGV